VRVGVVFPQTEIEPDPGVIRAYATAVEGLGYSHILAFEHVVGADPGQHPGWSAPYDVTACFQEPLVLFGYLAGITSLELVTGIIILPQRQTTLVAKQAATLDLLTGGNLRLGVGIGWNPVEYEALGQDFSQRGRRLGEQVELMRRLWTEPAVTFQGRYDRITGAGLAPLPVQRPIPVWFGGQSEPAYRRAGRLADGWFPQMGPGPQLVAAQRIVREAAEQAGRDPASLGMEGRISLSEVGGAAAVPTTLEQWQQAGATHVCINTMGAGLDGLSGHVRALTEVAKALRLG
jgi:probable F420-dependent oxidoreductase